MLGVKTSSLEGDSGGKIPEEHCLHGNTDVGWSGGRGEGVGD